MFLRFFFLEFRERILVFFKSFLREFQYFLFCHFVLFQLDNILLHICGGRAPTNIYINQKEHKIKCKKRTTLKYIMTNINKTGRARRTILGNYLKLRNNDTLKSTYDKKAR